MQWFTCNAVVDVVVFIVELVEVCLGGLLERLEEKSSQEREEEVGQSDELSFPEKVANCQINQPENINRHQNEKSKVKPALVHH